MIDAKIIKIYLYHFRLSLSSFLSINIAKSVKITKSTQKNETAISPFLCKNTPKIVKITTSIQKMKGGDLKF